MPMVLLLYYLLVQFNDFALVLSYIQTLKIRKRKIPKKKLMLTMAGLPRTSMERVYDFKNVCKKFLERKINTMAVILLLNVHPCPPKRAIIIFKRSMMKT
jgi:hypothetical protein